MNKKHMMMILGVVFAISGAYAQMPATPAMPANVPAQTVPTGSKSTVSEKAKALLDKVTAATHITPDQAKNVLPLLEEYYNKLETAKKSEPAKAGAETSAAKDNLLTKLKGLLNADQLEKVKTLITEKVGKL